MNASEKQKYIEEHCNTLRDAILERVEAMPDTWDGLELREYIADFFDKERFMQESAARKKEYKNRIVNYMSACLARNI